MADPPDGREVSQGDPAFASAAPRLGWAHNNNIWRVECWTGFWHWWWRSNAGERRALLWSFAYFFLILVDLLRSAAAARQCRHHRRHPRLPWLFTATFFVMLAAAPLYGWVVARLPAAA